MGKLKIDLNSLVLEREVKIPNRITFESPLRNKIKQMKAGDSCFFKDLNQARSFNTTIRTMSFNTALRKMDGGWRVWKLS